MYAVEFETILNNGVILVPAKYAQKFSGKVKVIILSEDEVIERKEEKVEIVKVVEKTKKNDRGFVPMSREEIYVR